MLRPYDKKVHERDQSIARQLERFGVAYVGQNSLDTAVHAICNVATTTGFNLKVKCECAPLLGCRTLHEALALVSRIAFRSEPNTHIINQNIAKIWFKFQLMT